MSVFDDVWRWLHPKPERPPEIDRLAAVKDKSVARRERSVTRLIDTLEIERDLSDRHGNGHGHAD